MLLNIPKLPEQGTRKITIEEVRPELLSFRIYRDTQYWWIFLVYNEILDINQLQPGVILLYPNINYVEYLYEKVSLWQKTV